MLSAFGVEHTEISKGVVSNALHWMGFGSKKYAQTQNQLKAVASAGAAKPNPMLSMVGEAKGAVPAGVKPRKPSRPRKPKTAPEPPPPPPASPPVQFRTGDFNAEKWGAKDMAANWAKKNKNTIVGTSVGTGAGAAGAAGTAYGLKKK